MSQESKPNTNAERFKALAEELVNRVNQGYGDEVFVSEGYGCGLRTGSRSRLRDYRHCPKSRLNGATARLWPLTSTAPRANGFLMDHECFKCTDHLEDRVVCYVCFQQMQKRIEELEAENAKLKGGADKS